MVGHTSFRCRTARAVRVFGLALAASAAITVSALSASPVAAAGPKVVIVVGPTGGATATYLAFARTIATQARSLGASVTEVYTPKATWGRVSAAAQGATLFVYLGHGTGYPSRYGFNVATSDGMGLNPSLDSGTTTPVKYYGESLIASTIRLAPHAVVLLNHLCYASGSAEPGMADPTWTVARQRVDNYARGFIGAGAGAVIADASNNVSYQVAAILRGANPLSVWRTDPRYHDHERSFASTRPGFTNHLDPVGTSSAFYRAITTTDPDTTAAAAAPPPLRATTSTVAKLRAAPSETALVATTIPVATTLAVTGKLVGDSTGRTWAPVRAPSGRTGYVAAWLLRFTGTAVAVTAVTLRSSPSLTSAKISTVRAAERVTLIGSTRDSAYRVWLNVRTSSGRTGWMAAWLMRP